MNGLSKKQKKVIDELFEGTENEDTVLANNNVSRKTYNGWLEKDAWIQEFDRHVDESLRRTQIIIAQFQPAAAIKLVELTNCEKEQTARQACLDIIQMPRIVAERKNQFESSNLLNVSETTSREILGLFAQDARNKRKNKS